MSSTSSIRLLLRGRDARAQRFQERPVAGQRQFQVLEHRQLLEHGRLLKFRPIPAATISGFGHLKQIDVAAKPRGSGIRAGLPGDDVHHGGLAGAVRADDAEQFARIDVQRESLSALKPSKLTVRFSR